MATVADAPPEVQSDPGPSFSDEMWAVLARAAARPADFDAPGNREALTFATWLEAQAARYRELGTEAGAFAWRLLANAAETARWLHAETPDQYAGRLAVMDDDRERIACGLPCQLVREGRMIPADERPEDADFGPDDSWHGPGTDGAWLDFFSALEAAAGRPDPLRPLGPGTFDHHGFVSAN